MDKLYEGPRDQKGQLLYPGWLLKGSELNWATWIVPPRRAASRSTRRFMWQGLADPAISPVGTIAYYQAVEDTMGGPAATQQFARLFMLPGVSHCGGGQGPSSMDALDAVVAWVEQGTPPTSLLTTQTPTAQNPVASLPLYPYPLVATDNGTGNPDVATSYHAALPPEAFDAHIAWAGAFTPAPPQHRG